MKKFGHDIMLACVKLMNIVLMTLPIALCWFGYYAERIANPFYLRGNWLVITLFLLLYAAFTKIYDALLISFQQTTEIICSQVLTALLSDGVMFLILWLMMRRFPNLLPALAALAGQILFAAAWAALARKWYFAVFPAKPSVVVYDTRRGLEQLIREYGLDRKFDIHITVSISECLQDIHMLDGMEAVFLIDLHSHDRNIFMKYCIERDIAVYVTPQVGDLLLSGARRRHILHLPVLQLTRYHPSLAYLLVKRLVDISFSAAAILVLSPLMLGTAIAVKAYDGGPILYKQVRLTQDGRHFNMWKFRSMRVDAERDGVARLSIGGSDSRITPVGRMIRRLRIDELPQLFCTLSGTMSLVGPRPERPELAEQYEAELPEFALRLQVKAGLTGYAQVYGKYNTKPYDKLRMDLMYIAYPSILEDFRILFATIKILFMSESTEGIAEDEATQEENTVESVR